MASTPVIQIDVFGDGAMMGLTGTKYGMPTMTAKSEPADLQDLLQQKFGDTGLSVVNHASGGTSSSLANELDGMDGNGPPLAQRIQSSPAAIVIDNHSVNDALGGESVSDYKGYLGQWIDAVLAANKIPVLEEPGPTCDTDHPQLPAYIAAMDAVAKQRGVALVKQYQVILDLPNWRSHMDSTCMYPDETLDALKAQQEAAVLIPILKNLIGG